MPNSQRQLRQQVSVLSGSRRCWLRPRPAMRAAGAPLARTSRLLLLLLLKVSASPALGSALAPREENCLGESCSPTLIQRRSRDAWGPGDSAGDLLPTRAPREEEQEAVERSAPPWDLPAGPGGDPGVGRGAEASAPHPHTPPTPTARGRGLCRVTAAFPPSSDVGCPSLQLLAKSFFSPLAHLCFQLRTPSGAVTPRRPS